MPDSFKYRLDLDPQPFVEGAKTAEAADKQLNTTVTTGAKEAAMALANVGNGMAEMGRVAETHAVKVRTLGEYMKQIGPIGAQAKSGFSNAGMGVLMLSQTMDDLQYGMAATVNQIPGLIMAFGGSAGLAGAVQGTVIAFKALGGVIVNEYKKAWDQLTGENQYQKLIAQNEAVAESHERMLAALRIGAAQAGDRTAEGAAGMADYDKRHRAQLQERHEAKKAELAIEQEIAKQKLAGLEPAQKAVALNELEKKQAAEKLDMEKKFYQERLTNLKNATGYTGNRHEDEKRLRELQEEERALALKPDDTKTEKEKRRAAAIGGDITAERTRIDTARGMFDADSAALRKAEAEAKLLNKRGTLGDMKTQQVVDAEAKKAADARFEADKKARKEQLDDPNHPDNVAAAKREKLNKLKEEAERRGIDVTKNGWARKLGTSIARPPASSAADDEEDDDDEDAPRRGRGRAAGRARIQGGVAAGSYQRDRFGNKFAMGKRGSDDTKDPRIANRGKAQGEVTMTKAEQAMLKVLSDIYRETRKQNSPKK